MFHTAQLILHLTKLGGCGQLEEEQSHTSPAGGVSGDFAQCSPHRERGVRPHRERGVRPIEKEGRLRATLSEDRHTWCEEGSLEPLSGTLGSILSKL